MNVDFLDFQNLNFIKFDPETIKLIQKRCENKIKIINSLPSVKEYQNVIYMPSTKFEGFLFLYEFSGEIIETSRIIRGSNRLGKEKIENFDNLNIVDKRLLYLGHIMDHYGHFLLEGLSRLWYLSEFSNIDQEFDYFLIHFTGKKLDTPYILKSLSLLEIDPQKLIWFNEPTQIKSVVIPESSFSLKNNAYRAYQKIFAPIHRKFEKIPTTEQPLYLSRSLYKKHRNCAEEENLEKILISNGFNIIHPQYLPLEEQIYLFNRHKYILGATGSALYSIVFSSNHKTVIHISCQDDFVKYNLPRATNHFLIAQCFNSESHYINSLKIKQDFRIINKLNRTSNKFLFNLPRILEKSLNQYQLNIDLFCNELKQMGLLEKY